jgi:predicted lipoprotein with Yx(FWY)xxD motif
MKRLLILGAAVAAVLALAACGGGGGGASGNAPGTMASGSNATTVSAEDIGDAGTVLVDSEGKALYASDEEAGGKVLCTDDACLSFWTPLTIDTGQPTGSALPGKLGVVKRPDGTRQVTYDGKLLYSFNEDEPGEVTGDGFVDAFGGQQFTWHVVQSNGSVGSSGSTGGTNTGPYGY